jgi:PKD repeat protein
VIWGNRSFAQISEGGTPPSFDFPEMKTLESSKSSFLVQAGFDVRAQIEADRKEQEATWGATPLKIGKRIFVNEAQGGLDLLRDGEKTVLPDGAEIWRLNIKSPGALAVGLYYDRFFIPKGGKLFIYNPENKALIGAFTERNNVATGKNFATEMVLGDELVVEYVSPVKTGNSGNAAMRKADLPRINISSLVYGYNHIYGTQDNSNIGGSNQCMVDVNCSPEGDEWQDEKKGVAKIVYTVDTQYVAMCSGSIVNNTAQNLTPYYLTAFHCIDGNVEYDTMTFYFHFERPDCAAGDTPPTTTKTMVGAEYVASSSIYGGSDGALLKLTEAIPLDYDIYYNGWDRTNPTAAFDGAGIHHPAGDLKKISTFEGATSFSQGINWQGGGNTPANAHWEVPFVATTNGSGGTEGGSSGSPLFNSEGLIMGTLSGGGSSCAPAESYYGKLWSHWDQGIAEPLAPYLDPIGTGQTTLAGSYVAAGTGAAFGMNAEEIYVFQTIKYTDYSSDATTWSWEFEGGTPDSFEGKTPPVITYNHPGVFTTTLTVNKGADDESVATRTATVTEKGDDPQPPVAGFFLAKKILLEEYFTGTTFPPEGWTTEKRGESDKMWARAEGATTPDPVSPTFVAFHTWDDDKIADNWLISPAVAIPEGFPVSVSFHCIGGNIHQKNAWTHFFVIDGETETEKWNNGHLENESAYVWEHPTVDLSEYAGKSVKLAWRYYGKAGDAAQIDGVVVGYSDPDEKVTINVGDYITPTDKSTGPPILYEWTFEGGEPASSDKETPGAVQYMTPGVYDITLKVKNYRGEDTRTLPEAVTVVEVPPVAAFETTGGYALRKNSGLFVPAGGEATFVDKSQHYPTAWTWNFGGGGEPDTSTEQQPVVKFNTEGEFNFAFKAENGAAADSIRIENGIKVSGRDTIWNFAYTERDEQAFYSAGTGNYVTGTNGGYFTAHAELFDAPLAKSAITAVKVNMAVEGATDAHQFPVIIAKVGPDGYPGAEITRTVFKPVNVNPDGETLIELESPAIVDGPFFVILGDAIGTDGNFASPGYTAAVTSTLNRGAGAKTTLYSFNYLYYLFYGMQWGSSNEFYVDLNLSMDVAPVLTYVEYGGIDVDKLSFKNADNTPVTVNVKSNVPWKATSDASWVVITDGRQDGDGAFTVSAKDNTKYNARKAIVKVSVGEGLDSYILVQQSGPAPSELTATVISEEKGEVELTWAAPEIVEPAEVGGDIYDDAENHPDFMINSPGDVDWTYIDVDGLTTYGFQGVTFPGMGEPSAFRVFNPSATSPVATGLETHDGSAKYFASFIATEAGATNDWMISPELAFKTDFKVSFWARSQTLNYGPERLRVVYSTTGSDAADFTNSLTPEPYMELPDVWTRYEYTLPADARYVAFNSVSYDSFIMFIDDIFIGTGVAPQSDYEYNPNSDPLTGTDTAQLLLKAKKASNVDNVGKRPDINDAEAQQAFNTLKAQAGETLVLTNEKTGETIDVIRRARTAEEKAPVGFIRVNSLDGTLSQAQPRQAADETIPLTKLRYDNGINHSAIVLGSPEDIGLEVAIRFTPEQLLKYQGAKMKAMDIFVANAPTDGITINIRQDSNIVHTQQAAVASGKWTRVKLTNEIAIDASKDLYAGYAGIQRNELPLPGVDQGPAKAGKSDLIAIGGQPFESLSGLSADLNVNWNIALLVEDKGEQAVDLSYNIYRDSELIGSTSDLTHLDRMTDKEACYEVTAVYNGTIESTPGNTSCVKLDRAPKRSLTVTVEDATRFYGDANPVFVMHYDGFVDGHTEADLETPPIAVTVAEATSPVGEYDIELSGGIDTRYDFIYVNGTLAVTPKPQAIDFPEIPEQFIHHTAYTLNATASSGLPVEYTVADVLVADFASDGRTLLFKKTGQTDVTAYVAPNPNYTDAQPVTRSLVIKGGNDTGHTITLSSGVDDTVTPHIVDCSTNEIHITATPDDPLATVTFNGKSYPGNRFTLATPKGGQYTVTIAVKAADGVTAVEQVRTFVKAFDFFEIAVIRFGNTLVVNNNPETNGGYTFTGYQWYRNGIAVGTGQAYTNPSGLGASHYHVIATTSDGQTLTTCSQAFATGAMSVKAYPNPTNVGTPITVEANLSDDMLEDAIIEVYNAAGTILYRETAVDKNNSITLPDIVGAYIIRLISGDYDQTIKVVVK